MTTDIVERLRSVGGLEGTGRWYINPDGAEAADEIERLRRQVDFLNQKGGELFELIAKLINYISDGGKK